MLAVVALVLFAVSGVWPPMVAIESGSMEPHMTKGDLVFITEPGRLSAADAALDGVVTSERGRSANYRTFGGYGDVIIFKPNGGTDTPIIHRAMFHVERGENWYSKADPAYVTAESCDGLRYCPAPHAGYITKGDANPTYDQSYGRTAPVKRGWVIGTSKTRIPWLGWIRLSVTA